MYFGLALLRSVSKPPNLPFQTPILEPRMGVWKGANAVLDFLLLEVLHAWIFLFFWVLQSWIFCFLGFCNVGFFVLLGFRVSGLGFKA